MFDVGGVRFTAELDTSSIEQAIQSIEKATYEINFTVNANLDPLNELNKHLDEIREKYQATQEYLQNNPLIVNYQENGAPSAGDPGNNQSSAPPSPQNPTQNNQPLNDIGELRNAVQDLTSPITELNNALTNFADEFRSVTTSFNQMVGSFTSVIRDPLNSVAGEIRSFSQDTVGELRNLVTDPLREVTGEIRDFTRGVIQDARNSQNQGTSQRQGTPRQTQPLTPDTAQEAFAEALAQHDQENDNEERQQQWQQNLLTDMQSTFEQIPTVVTGPLNTALGGFFQEAGERALQISMNSLSGTDTPLGRMLAIAPTDQNVLAQRLKTPEQVANFGQMEQLTIDQKEFYAPVKKVLDSISAEIQEYRKTISSKTTMKRLSGEEVADLKQALKQRQAQLKEQVDEVMQLINTVAKTIHPDDAMGNKIAAQLKGQAGKLAGQNMLGDDKYFERKIDYHKLNAKAAGQGIGKDLIAGIKKGMPDAEALFHAREVAEKIIEGTQTTLGIQSPSKVFKWMGQMVRHGWRAGVRGISGDTTEIIGEAVREAEEVAHNATIQMNPIPVGEASTYRNMDILAQEIDEVLSRVENKILEARKNVAEDQSASFPNQVAFHVGKRAGQAYSRAQSTIQSLENEAEEIQQTLSMLSGSLKQEAKQRYQQLKNNISAMKEEAAKRKEEADKRTQEILQERERNNMWRQDYFDDMFDQFGEKIMGRLEGQGIERGDAEQLVGNAGGYAFSLGAAWAPAHLVTGFLLPTITAILPTVLALASVANFINPVMARVGEVIDKIDALQGRFISLAPTKEGRQEEFDYVQGLSRKYDVDLAGIAEQYTQIRVASRGTALEGDKLREVFEAITLSAKAMNLSGFETELIFNAYTQMMAKGKISMEELRQQLGEKFPPAMSIFSKALGVSSAQFEQLASKGALMTEEVLPKVATVLKSEFGGAVQEMRNTYVSAVTRMDNATTDLNIKLVNSYRGAFVAMMNIGAAFTQMIADNFDFLNYALTNFTIGIGAIIAVGSQTIFSTTPAISKTVGVITDFFHIVLKKTHSILMPTFIGIGADLLGKIFGTEYDVMFFMVNGIGQAVTAAIKSMDNAGMKGIAKAGAGEGDLVKEVNKALSEQLTLWESIQVAIKNFFVTSVRGWSLIFGALSELFYFLSTLEKQTASFLTSLYQGTASAFNNMVDVYDTKLKVIIKDFVKWFKQLNLFAPVITVVKPEPTFKEKITQFFADIKQAIDKQIESLNKSFRKFIQSIKDWGKETSNNFKKMWRELTGQQTLGDRFTNFIDQFRGRPPSPYTNIGFDNGLLPSDIQAPSVPLTEENTIDVNEVGYALQTAKESLKISGTYLLGIIKSIPESFAISGEFIKNLFNNGENTAQSWLAVGNFFNKVFRDSLAGLKISALSIISAIGDLIPDFSPPATPTLPGVPENVSVTIPVGDLTPERNSLEEAIDNVRDIIGQQLDNNDIEIPVQIKRGPWEKFTDWLRDQLRKLPDTIDINVPLARIVRNIGDSFKISGQFLQDNIINALDYYKFVFSSVDILSSTGNLLTTISESLKISGSFLLDIIKTIPESFAISGEFLKNLFDNSENTVQAWLAVGNFFNKVFRDSIDALKISASIIFTAIGDLIPDFSFPQNTEQVAPVSTQPTSSSPSAPVNIPVSIPVGNLAPERNRLEQAVDSVRDILGENLDDAGIEVPIQIKRSPWEKFTDWLRDQINKLPDSIDFNIPLTRILQNITDSLKISGKVLRDNIVNAFDYYKYLFASIDIGNSTKNMASIAMESLQISFDYLARQITGAGSFYGQIFKETQSSIGAFFSRLIQNTIDGFKISDNFLDQQITGAGEYYGNLIKSISNGKNILDLIKDAIIPPAQAAESPQAVAALSPKTKEYMKYGAFGPAVNMDALDLEAAKKEEELMRAIERYQKTMALLDKIDYIIYGQFLLDFVQNTFVPTLTQAGQNISTTFGDGNKQLQSGFESFVAKYRQLLRNLFGQVENAIPQNTDQAIFSGDDPFRIKGLSKKTRKIINNIRLSFAISDQFLDQQISGAGNFYGQIFKEAQAAISSFFSRLVQNAIDGFKISDNFLNQQLAGAGDYYSNFLKDSQTSIASLFSRLIQNSIDGFKISDQFLNDAFYGAIDYYRYLIKNTIEVTLPKVKQQLSLFGKNIVDGFKLSFTTINEYFLNAVEYYQNAIKRFVNATGIDKQLKRLGNNIADGFKISVTQIGKYLTGAKDYYRSLFSPRSQTQNETPQAPITPLPPVLPGETTQRVAEELQKANEQARQLQENVGTKVQEKTKETKEAFKQLGEELKEPERAANVISVIFKNLGDIFANLSKGASVLADIISNLGGQAFRGALMFTSLYLMLQQLIVLVAMHGIPFLESLGHQLKFTVWYLFSAYKETGNWRKALAELFPTIAMGKIMISGLVAAITYMLMTFAMSKETLKNPWRDEAVTKGMQRFQKGLIEIGTALKDLKALKEVEVKVKYTTELPSQGLQLDPRRVFGMKDYSYTTDDFAKDKKTGYRRDVSSLKQFEEGSLNAQLMPVGASAQFGAGFAPELVKQQRKGNRRVTKLTALGEAAVKFNLEEFLPENGRITDAFKDFANTLILIDDKTKQVKATFESLKLDPANLQTTYEEDMKPVIEDIWVLDQQLKEKKQLRISLVEDGSSATKDKIKEVDDEIKNLMKERELKVKPLTRIAFNIADFESFITGQQELLDQMVEQGYPAAAVDRVQKELDKTKEVVREVKSELEKTDFYNAIEPLVSMFTKATEAIADAQLAFDRFKQALDKENSLLKASLVPEFDGIRDFYNQQIDFSSQAKELEEATNLLELKKAAYKELIGIGGIDDNPERAKQITELRDTIADEEQQVAALTLAVAEAQKEITKAGVEMARAQESANLAWLNTNNQTSAMNLFGASSAVVEGASLVGQFNEILLEQEVLFEQFANKIGDPNEIKKKVADNKASMIKAISDAEELLENTKKNIKDFEKEIKAFNKRIGDLQKDVNKQIRQATIDLLQTQSELARVTFSNELKKLLGQNPGQIFDNIAQSLEELFNSIDENAVSSLDYETQKLETEERILTIKEQIESLTEEALELEKKRTQAFKNMEAQIQVIEALTKQMKLRFNETHIKTAEIANTTAKVTADYTNSMQSIATSISEAARKFQEFVDSINITQSNPNQDNQSNETGDQVVGKNGKILLGYSGNTGDSTGPHGHFTIKINGKRVNPVDHPEIMKLIQVGDGENAKTLDQYIKNRSWTGGSPYGPRRLFGRSFHGGVDLPLPRMTPIYYTGNLNSLESKTAGAYGKAAFVDLGNGITLEVGHLDKFAPPLSQQNTQAPTGNTVTLKTGSTAIDNYKQSGASKHLITSSDGWAKAPLHHQMAAKIIAEEEGFVPNAKVIEGDRTGIPRAGFSTQFLGDRANAYRIGNSVTATAATNQLMNYDVKRFEKSARDSLGKVYDTLNEETKAVMISLAYLWGSIPSDIVAVAKTGDKNKLADAVQSKIGGSSGRSKRESDVIRNSGNLTNVPLTQDQLPAITTNNVPSLAVNPVQMKIPTLTELERNITAATINFDDIDIKGVEELQRILEQQDKATAELAKQRQVEIALSQKDRLMQIQKEIDENLSSMLDNAASLTMETNDLLAGIKGYSTIQEEIVKAGEETRRSFEGQRKQVRSTIKEVDDLIGSTSNIANGTILPEKTVRALQSQIDKYKQINGLLPEQQEALKEAEKTLAQGAVVASEMLTIRQTLLTLEQRLNAEQEKAIQLAMQRKEIELNRAKLDYITEIQSSYFETLATNSERLVDGYIDNAIYSTSAALIRAQRQLENDLFDIETKYKEGYFLPTGNIPQNTSIEELTNSNKRAAELQAIAKYEQTINNLLLSEKEIEDKIFDAQIKSLEIQKAATKFKYEELMLEQAISNQQDERTYNQSRQDLLKQRQLALSTGNRKKAQRINIAIKTLDDNFTNSQANKVDQDVVKNLDNILKEFIDIDWSEIRDLDQTGLDQWAKSQIDALGEQLAKGEISFDLFNDAVDQFNRNLKATLKPLHQIAMILKDIAEAEGEKFFTGLIEAFPAIFDGSRNFGDEIEKVLLSTLNSITQAVTQEASKVIMKLIKGEPVFKKAPKKLTPEEQIQQTVLATGEALNILRKAFIEAANDIRFQNSEDALTYDPNPSYTFPYREYPDVTFPSFEMLPYESIPAPLDISLTNPNTVFEPYSDKYSLEPAREFPYEYLQRPSHVPDTPLEYNIFDETTMVSRALQDLTFSVEGATSRLNNISVGTTNPDRLPVFSISPTSEDTVPAMEVTPLKDNSTYMNDLTFKATDNKIGQVGETTKQGFQRIANATSAGISAIASAISGQGSPDFFDWANLALQGASIGLSIATSPKTPQSSSSTTPKSSTKTPNASNGLTVKNYNDGGPVMALGQSVSEAMDREGAGAVPIVAHVGEEVLAYKNGDSQYFRYLKNTGEWDKLKAMKNKPVVNNYNAGGSVGAIASNLSKNVTTNNTRNQTNTTINAPIYVTTPDANSFRKSQRQIDRERKIRMERL